VDICIEHLKFKPVEWIACHHGNQSKYQQPPESTTNIKCSFEQTTSKNSDRGMSSISQQPDPFGLIKSDHFGFMKLNHRKESRNTTTPTFVVQEPRNTYQTRCINYSMNLKIEILFIIVTGMCLNLPVLLVTISMVRS